MSRVYKGLVSAAIASCAAIGSAHAALAVRDAATQNVSCSAGVCTATAAVAVMNVTDLMNMLASSNVSLVCGNKAKDIKVQANLSWTSASRLTLDSHRSILVDSIVTVVGTGAVTLTTNDGGTGGTLSFTAPGRIAFWDLSSSLVINGATYVLAGNIATLASDVAANPSGRYALANNYDASVDGRYAHPPVSTALAGAVEGLGNTISKLTVHDTTVGENVGLFGSIAPGGSVNDLLLMTFSGTGGKHNGIGGLAGMNAGTLQGDFVEGIVHDIGADGFSGMLVGVNLGTIRNCRSEGAIKQSRYTWDALGGLVGYNESLIDRSSSSASISSPEYAGYLGGLVGRSNGGTITNSSATGAVTSINYLTPVGGLLGSTQGSAGTSIVNSYATGAVTGRIAGGLVGELVQAGDSVVDSHASGDISASGYGGGLVGSQGLGTTISGSHATGNISGIGDHSIDSFGGLVGLGQGAIATSSASGNVVLSSPYGGEAGGLVGYNSGGIDRSFATGSVTTTSTGLEGGLIGMSDQTLAVQELVVNSYATGAVGSVTNSSILGGLAGRSYGRTYISESYEIGTVSRGMPSAGFIAESQNLSGHNTNDYWDTTTSGQTKGVGPGSDDGVTGLTDAQLKSGLPTGFDPSIWAENPSINGGYPYLIANPPQ